MENNKREWPPVRRPRRRGVNIRPIALALALVLLVGAAVGGTIAWLTDNTAPVTNTFTDSDINIELTETGAANNAKSFKMVPGQDIEKDPKVTVKANSEACWLFVKIEESTTPVLRSYLTYTVASGWTELESGVYYRQVSASNADQDFAVLANDKVTVKTDVTKAMMDAIDEDSEAKPTLTFTAYAIQQASFNDAAAAWAEASK